MADTKSSLTVQQARISDREKDLLAGFFKDNELALIALRNLFLGFDLDKEETALLKTLRASSEGLQLMRKIFLPEIAKDNPIGQTIDLWMTLKFDDPARDQNNIAKYQLMIFNLDKALSRLDGNESDRPDLSVDMSYEGILSRSTYITHVENQVMAIKIMANEQRDTNEQRVLKLAKDSLK